MMKIDIDANDLLMWGRYAEEEVKKTRPRIANALNQLGDGVVRGLSLELADATGLPSEQVRGMIEFTRASSGRLEYDIDTSRLLDPRLVPQRPMAGREWRGRETGAFDTSELVNVLTAGDDRVCQLCEDIADNGPYTYAVARAMIPHHPNCRCTLIPFTPTRRLPLTYSTRMGAAPRSVALSIPQLVERLLSVSKILLVPE